MLTGARQVGKTPAIYYYRDKDRREIDLLIEHNGMVYPIEIKKSASPDQKAIKHFKVLDALENTASGAVVFMADDLLPIDKNNWSVPVWMI